MIKTELLVEYKLSFDCSFIYVFGLLHWLFLTPIVANIRSKLFIYDFGQVSSQNPVAQVSMEPGNCGLGVEI